MATKVHSAQTVGLHGKIIDVEIDTHQGLYHFTIVGLPDKAVEESTVRIKHSRFISEQNLFRGKINNSYI